MAFATMRRKFWSFLLRTGLPRLFSDEFFTKFLYWSYVGKRLNLETPRDINQKIQWLKVYYRNPLIVTCADKWAVRKYVEDRIGPGYMTRCLGVFSRAEDINFGSLPDRFVLKATHASGWNVICQDKSRLNWKDAAAKVHKWLKRDFSRVGREWQYGQIPPKIICEEYIDALDRGEFMDYRLFAFNGDVKFVLVEFSRQENGKWDVSEEKVGGNKPNRRKGVVHYTNFYKPDWEGFPGVVVGDAKSDPDSVARPECLDEMISAARKLAGGFPFCRVDFYVLNGKKALFSELTFTPAKGCYMFNSQDFADKMGDCLVLPEKESDR